LEIELPSLPETKFDAIPTEEELTTLLRDHKVFWTRVAGILFAANKYAITDEQQRMNKLLGVPVQLQMVIDAFQGRGDIARPQLQMVPRHQ